MRHFIIIIALTVITAVSCEKEWVSSIELGVNTERVNIDSVYEGEFYFTVFAADNINWTLSVTEGEDWLVPGISSYSGIGHVYFSYSANMDDNARIARFLLRAESGKEISVTVVQSGLNESASSVELY